MTPSDARAYIQKRIKEEGFFYTDDKAWLTPDGNQALWTFDLKSLLLDKDFLQATCDLFWSMHDKDEPIQICGLEAASIPLVTALVMSGNRANGLYVRKSRKKKYDLRELEGELNNAPIVIVDDVVNSGSSLEKQLRVLKKFGRDARFTFAFVHLRPLHKYEYLKFAYGIKPDFIFSLTDFGQDFDRPNPPALRFIEKWKYETGWPHTFNVERRNQIAVTADTVCINADDGRVHALSTRSGEVYWKEFVQKTVPLRGNQPGILAWNDAVIAATENGTLVKLSARDGFVSLQKSVADELWGDIDYIPDHGLCVSGRQGQGYFFGLFDDTFNLKWKFETKFKVTGFHLVSDLVILTTNGEVTALHASNGKIKWHRNLEGAIFDGIGVDEDNYGYVVTEQGRLQKFKLSNGKVVKERDLDEPFFHTRCVADGDRLFITSLHRTLYCLDRASLETLWEFNTRGRIFGRPVVSQDLVYFGNNECLLYAIDATNGRQLGSVMLDERIVSEPVVLADGDVIVSTIANTTHRFGIERP